MPQPQRKFDKKRLTIADRFLQGTKPLGNNEFSNELVQATGKELSVANLDKEDITSYIKGFGTAIVFYLHGQNRTKQIILTLIQAELKLSMSIDNEFSHLLFRDTLEYTQTQNVHEYVHEPARKKFFGGNR